VQGCGIAFFRTFVKEGVVGKMLVLGTEAGLSCGG
jgi:hypothetical protein